MAIDPEQFAEHVVRRASLRRVWPEYLAAVAKVRTDISDTETPKGFGPFGLTQARWDAEIKDPELSELVALEAVLPGQIKRWRQQVTVVALMTGKAQAALVLKSGKDFSFIDLYNAQWPDEQITSADLDKALQAVERSIDDALAKVGSDVQATIDSTLVLAGGAGTGGILGEMVGKIESKGNYNAFNRGTAGVSPGGPINLVGMTIGEIRAQQAKAKTDPTRLFAVGKYQIVPGTMNETVEKLSVQNSELYAPGLQEKMFRKYLVGDKRKVLKSYIMGKHNDLDLAQIDLANEFASVPKPGGGSAHAGSGGNAALITSDKARAAINAERDRFKALRDAGKSEEDAWVALSPGLVANATGGATIVGSATDLSENFSLEEFTRSSAALALKLDNNPTPEHLENLRNLAAHMEKVRALFNLPIEITSGYRSPAVNQAVDGAPNSAHAFGHAADFHVHGVEDLDAAKKIRDSKLKFDQLIFEKNRCVHFSVDPRMRRQVLRQPGGPGSTVFDGLEP